MTSRVEALLREGQRLIDANDAHGRCGARTRSGEPCRAPGNGAGGRCKLHGGKSTGPRSKKGKEVARLAVIRRWEKWRDENASIATPNARAGARIMGFYK
jgi:hypothetical protein